MKTVMIFAMTLMGLSTFAQNTPPYPPGTPAVEIKSFRYVERGNSVNTTAEVCGVVHGSLIGNEKVLLVVDPKYNPGDYVVMISPKGNFCTLVNSLTGRLEFGLIFGKNS